VMTTQVDSGPDTCKLPVSLMTVLAGTGVAEYTVAMMRTSIFGF